MVVNWDSSLDSGVKPRVGLVRAGAEPKESMDAVEFARRRLGFDPDEKQVQVLRGGRRGIVNCSRQWGKSTVTAAKAVHRACTEPGSLVLVVTPCGRQSGEFVRKAEDFVRRLGMKVRGDGDNGISIVFPNGSRIVGLPGNEATVRGYSASLVLIDEASRVEDPIYQAIRPSLAAKNGDLWLMSTPFCKRGFFYEEWTNGGPGWERICVPATECSRIEPEFLEEERTKNFWFEQEYLCVFYEIPGAIFSRESIEAAFEDFEPLKL